MRLISLLITMSGLMLALGCAGVASNLSAQQAEEGTELTTLTDSLQPLIDRFNAEKDKPRIVAILSPT